VLRHGASDAQTPSDHVLEEFTDSPIAHPDPQLQTLLRAIFVEDCLAVRLSDAELTPGALDDLGAVLKGVAEG
jgi:hypothetical protein